MYKRQAVNDGLLNRLQAVLAADNQLTHREDAVGFQRQRVFLFGVVRVDVQRIDVVRADRRNADNLTAELLHKGEILGFGVTCVPAERDGGGIECYHSF